MKSPDAREIVKKLKKKEQESEKANMTFRLRTSVVEQFKAACEKQGVMPGAVVEELMKSFALSAK